GPAVEETIPPIPIHMNIDKYSGGYSATNPAIIKTICVPTRPIFKSIFSVFFFSMSKLGTLDTLHNSLASNTCQDTINPADVDITADNTAIARNAAINGRNNSVNNVGMTASGRMSISPGNTAIANIPPSPISGSIVAKTVVHINNFFKSRLDLTAINLFPKCG